MRGGGGNGTPAGRGSSTRQRVRENVIPSEARDLLRGYRTPFEKIPRFAGMNGIVSRFPIFVCTPRGEARPAALATMILLVCAD